MLRREKPVRSVFRKVPRRGRENVLEGEALEESVTLFR